MTTKPTPSLPTRTEILSWAGIRLCPAQDLITSRSNTQRAESGCGQIVMTGRSMGPTRLRLCRSMVPGECTFRDNQEETLLPSNTHQEVCRHGPIFTAAPTKGCFLEAWR